jgi:hypothetical protein
MTLLDSPALMAAEFRVSEAGGKETVLRAWAGGYELN